MPWMRWTGIAAALLALAGCGYGYRMAAVSGRYSAGTRPDASYFCYDCHGYRYFDPYYDYCESYGFRYRWSSHPGVVGIYRTRYVRIKESHPDYGRYRYREGYRATPRYREPRDYEAWRGGTREKPAPGVSQDRKSGEREKQKEKLRDNPGRKKDRKGDERKGPRDTGLRPTLRGGTS
jgi:hypothetical protein